jgi:hypothetical protein
MPSGEATVTICWMFWMCIILPDSLWSKGGPIFEGGTGSDFDAAGAAACHVVILQ